MHDAVAIGDGVGDVIHHDAFTIEVMAQLHDAAVVGFGGQAARRHLFIGQALQYVFMRQNGRAFRDVAQVAGDIASGKCFSRLGDFDVPSGVFG